MEPILIAYLAVTLIAVVDVWLSRLSSGAKVLWSLAVTFLSVVGLAAWLITRGSAHGPLQEA